MFPQIYYISVYAQWKLKYKIPIPFEEKSEVAYEHTVVEWNTVIKNNIYEDRKENIWRVFIT